MGTRAARVEKFDFLDGVTGVERTGRCKIEYTLPLPLSPPPPP